MKRLLPLLALVGGLAGCVATDEDFRQLPQAKRGQAVVYCYRQQQFTGSAIPFLLQVDGRPVAELVTGSLVVIDLQPGHHRLSAVTEAEGALALEVAADQRYFVEATVVTGVLLGVPSFNQVTDTKGERALRLIDRQLPLSAPPASGAD